MNAEEATRALRALWLLLEQAQLESQGVADDHAWLLLANGMTVRIERKPEHRLGRRADDRTFLVTTWVAGELTTSWIVPAAMLGLSNR